MHVMQNLAALSRPFGSVSRRSSPKWLQTSTPDEGRTAGTGAARLDETGFHASVQLRCRTDVRHHHLGMLRSSCPVDAQRHPAAGTAV